MQSGTTGINTTLVHNPIKQAQDHDPKGIFVRRWLPSMRKVPDSWLFEPWKMPANLQSAANESAISAIAIPAVELTLATRESKDKLHALRKTQAVRAGKEAVIDKHASRKTLRQPNKSKSAKFDSAQLGFNFGCPTQNH